MTANAKRYYRKVLHICAEDSPNVTLGLTERAMGLEPSGKVVIPGVLTWPDYVKRRKTWDKVQQCIGLDGKFYKGAELLLFPPDWISHSERLAHKIDKIHKNRRPKGLGIDPGEGGANTAIVWVDEYGMMGMETKPTPNPRVIHRDIISLIERFDIDHDRVCIDRGGGGFHVAAELREAGYEIRTVPFGAPVQPPVEQLYTEVGEKMQMKEERYVFMNLRAQMYGELSLLMDPSGPSGGYGIPKEFRQIRQQLGPVPKTYNEEGRLYILPKTKKNPDSKQRTLVEIIGHSPDEADALALAVHAMLHEVNVPVIGAGK